MLTRRVQDSQYNFWVCWHCYLAGPWIGLWAFMLHLSVVFAHSSTQKIKHWAPGIFIFCLVLLLEYSINPRSRSLSIAISISFSINPSPSPLHLHLHLVFAHSPVWKSSMAPQRRGSTSRSHACGRRASYVGALSPSPLGCNSGCGSIYPPGFHHLHFLLNSSSFAFNLLCFSFAKWAEIRWRWIVGDNYLLI